ncbi:hypothetical protein GRI75_03745 [Altererythrobacter soli]|uniref:Uncharacterized protein n=1 Tax=Croceibacterium soli TaxID=1739690 RepID=A0A6I4USU5_9SPHN|nr:hypothetical protein [Croceibacterium soli]MXP40759.1 hypothetical protein [Croceibacterium soli]
MDFEAAGIGGSDDGGGRAEGSAEIEMRRRHAGNAAVASGAPGRKADREAGEDMVGALHLWLAFRPDWPAERG